MSLNNRDYNRNVELTVLVPAFNEKENMAPLAKEFRKMLSTKRINAEVIIIDDGSDDGTSEEVQRLMHEFSFLRLAVHRKNLGKTAALVTGYRISKGDKLVIFDADMQFDPWDIPRMMDKLDEGYDIVTGKKIGKYQKPFISGIYNKMCRSLFNVPVTDLNSIKLFKREVMTGLTLRDDWHRYMVVLAVSQGFSVAEIDVTLSPRLHGVSKYTGIWRMFIGFFDLLAVWFMLTFMKKPMLYFGTLGFFTLSGAVLTGIVAIILRFVYDMGYRPLLSLVELLAEIGIILFIFAALGEMIASLREKQDFLIYNLTSKGKEKSFRVFENKSSKHSKYSGKSKDKYSDKRDSKSRNFDRSKPARSNKRTFEEQIEAEAEQLVKDFPSKATKEKYRKSSPKREPNFDREKVHKKQEEKPKVEKVESSEKDVKYGRNKRNSSVENDSKPGKVKGVGPISQEVNKTESSPKVESTKMEYGRSLRKPKTPEMSESLNDNDTTTPDSDSSNIAEEKENITFGRKNRRNKNS